MTESERRLQEFAESMAMLPNVLGFPTMVSADEIARRARDVLASAAADRGDYLLADADHRAGRGLSGAPSSVDEFAPAVVEETP